MTCGVSGSFREILHLQSNQNIFVSFQTGSHHSAAITVSGALLVFGRNKHGQVRPMSVPS
jgi:alpha-tubulin suppressor-like RCC1 family protein